MTRRFAVLIALTLLLGGCDGAAENEWKKGSEFAGHGDWDSAISCFSEAIRLDPDYGYAYYHRGSAYYEKGEYDAAIKDYSDAIRLLPEQSRSYVYQHRGDTYRKIGDQAKADADYARGYFPRAKK